MKAKYNWTDRRISVAARLAFIQAAIEASYSEIPERPWEDEFLTRLAMQILDRWNIPLPREIAWADDLKATPPNGKSPTSENK